jgi:hypothetical protein
MLACLAARFPQHFLPLVYKKAGISAADEYSKLRRKDLELVDYSISQCGDGYRALLSPGLRRFPTLQEIATYYHAPLIEVDNINSGRSMDLLKTWRPDIIVSLGDRIIKRHILAIPRLGILNAHSSLLPKYRGTATEFWQLVNGETSTGVTIHWMAERVDEGAVLIQREWPIPPAADHWQLRLASQFLRLPMWREAIRLAIAGDPGRPQGTSDQPTFGMPRLEDLYNYYILRRRH